VVVLFVGLTVCDFWTALCVVVLFVGLTVCDFWTALCVVVFFSTKGLSKF
jgi:FtsH-binding integral membrane protein